VRWNETLTFSPSGARDADELRLLYTFGKRKTAPRSAVGRFCCKSRQRRIGPLVLSLPAAALYGLRFAGQRMFGHSTLRFSQFKLWLLKIPAATANLWRRATGAITSLRKNVRDATGRLSSSLGHALESSLVAMKRLLASYWHIVVALIAILAFVLLFSWVWEFERLRSYAAAAGTAVGAVALAAAPFLPQRYLWAFLLCGGICTAWGAWFTTVDMTKKSEELAKKDADLTTLRQDVSKRNYRIQMLQNYFLDLAAHLPDAGKAEVLTRGGAVASQRFQDALSQLSPFSDEAARDVTDLLTKLDRNNGHGLYFSGEIDWHRQRADRGQTQFYAYLEEEQRLVPQFRGDTSAAACRGPKGYCRQRTAWINHLLANDFYTQALKEEAGKDARTTWNTVFLHTCTSKKLFDDVGFNQLTPTATIEQETEKRLQKRCPTK
jgi:hypothetical protein